MTCKDFQRKWNELLDAEKGASAAPGSVGIASREARSTGEADASLMAHAADCPACRPIAARYQTLRHAIRAWQRPPMAPAGLVHRILSVSDDLTPGTRRPVTRRARRFWLDHWDGVRLISRLAATILVCMVLLGTLLPLINREFRATHPEAATQIAGGEPQSIIGPRDAPGGPPALDRALAEATSATWDLARSASEPAARIGREVLDATAQTGRHAVVRSVSVSRSDSADLDRGLGSLSVSVPSLDSLGSDAAAGSSTILQQVGHHLSAGVQPLSSTARHAFGFLLGPPPARTGSPPVGSTSSGARSG